MQDYLYSAIALIAIVIQLVINYRVMFTSGKSSTQKAARKYRLLMMTIFAYYITDAFWAYLLVSTGSRFCLSIPRFIM